MLAPRSRQIGYPPCALTLTAAAAMLFASCGDTARFLAHMRELRIVQQHVAVVAGTSDVSVDLQDDHVLTIRIGNEDASGKPGAGRRELFRRIAAAGYLAFPSRSQLEAVIVDIAGQGPEPQRFRPIQLVEPSGLDDHWVNPQQSATQLYFVGVGNIHPDLVKELTAHFRQTLGLDIQELPAISFDPVTVDTDRSQVVAEELIAAIRRRHPALALDTHARIIGVTGDDMFLRKMAGSWGFGFSLRSDDAYMAVVSYARMDPAALGLSPDPDMLRSRLTKMVAKNIGVLYYGLPLSNDPRSALYGNIGGTDELDVMTEYFEPQPATPASR